MEKREVHGIGRRNSMVAGTLARQSNDIMLQLADGTSRRFGVESDYSLQALEAEYHSLKGLKAETSAREAATQFFASPSCAIIEITNFCDVGCPTCIADSVATRDGELSLFTFEERVEWLISSGTFPQKTPLMISGGEPTQHPHFLQFISSKQFLQVDHRYVITSGFSFADKAFAREFSRRSPDTRLYLQYDSFVPDHLMKIRGRNLSEVRAQSIANCEEYEIPYTLICVVCRGVNDAIASEIVSRNIFRKYCEGVTFQPIKMVGRNIFARDVHQLSTFDLASEIFEDLKSEMNLTLRPHPANPLNWAIAYTGGEPSAPVLYEAGMGKRVAIVWHTDRNNYVAESVARHPVAFALHEKLVPLELHYSAI